ncbi:Elongin-C [Lachnellula subtilissima]|uniref:Elongin-C n=1 Tax=Lachnellula subtilissima TaxID=602034 RepID=A0A8H8RDZ6_9HELO|nr:Elongin-C [Lachnellula subtilissima]
MASFSQSQAPSKYVTLISSDGFEFVVLREAACISGAIKRMLDPNSGFLESTTGRCQLAEIKYVRFHLTSNIRKCEHRRQYMQNGRARVKAVTADDYINKNLRTDPLSPQGKVVTLDDAYTLDLRPDILPKLNQGSHHSIHTARLTNSFLNSGIVLEKVAEYFYYNYRNRNREDVPDMEIPPELCLELLMAADFLDSELRLPLKYVLVLTYYSSVK